MMSGEKPEVQASKNILRPADEPRASSHRSRSPLERETRMERMLPAQLGTRLDAPGGLTFKATKQRESLEQLGPSIPSGQSSTTVPTDGDVRVLQGLSPREEQTKWTPPLDVKRNEYT